MELRLRGDAMRLIQGRMALTQTPFSFRQEATMKIKYDPEVDALSIIFRETTVTTQKVAEGITAEYDVEGFLVGIEILEAVKWFGERETLRQVILEEIGLGVRV